MDVVVVGAGIAGLATARRLFEAGLRVAVLEARDRVGGRLLSARVDGVGLDLGATWFWPTERRITRLIAELGVATAPQHLHGDALLQLPTGVQRIDGNPIDVTSGRFVHGAQALAEAVREQLPPGAVRLERAVTAVEIVDGRLFARTPQERYVARHVVIAMAPALAISAIRFTPELPGRLVDLARSTPVWMGAITKVVVEYATAFWREEGLAGAAMSHVGPLREIHDMSGPDGRPAALFGFAPPVSVGAPTITAERVVHQLTTLFGSAAASPTSVRIRDWRDEPFTSPPGVERLNDYETFGHAAYTVPAADGRLHWASTETATESPGHIEGALAAADRAATAIIESPG
ncbi:MAG: FAD-dependent oxidoreductase [Deltaproteobacteria bacterium]|nr:FAD-dependent oxidoreductase [Deltaproteobacteria bacterium]